MKQFFLDILTNLDKLAGLRQIEKIYAQHSDQNAAKAEINALLTVLVNVCEQFKYIPDEEKKRLINHAVITDPEFNSLNARIVFKWLASHKDKYYKEAAHIETVDANWTPVPKDSPAYQDYLNQWLAALKPMEERTESTSKKEQILGKDLADVDKVKHENGLTPEIVMLQDEVRRVGAERYKGFSTTNFKNFNHNNVNIFARSEDEAIDILETAMKNLPQFMYAKDKV